MRMEPNDKLKNKSPLLIIMAGLPGTGKTTVAKALVKELSLVYLRLDCIEVPFNKLNVDAGSRGEGYEAIMNLAKENLNLGMSVIIDSVNPLHVTRKNYRELAKSTESLFLQFEVKTNDKSLHKQRIEQRKEDIDGHLLPTWKDMKNLRYEDWDDSLDGLATVIYTDDGDKGIKECLKIIGEYLEK